MGRRGCELRPGPWPPRRARSKILPTLTHFFWSRCKKQNSNDSERPVRYVVPNVYLSCLSECKLQIYKREDFETRRKNVRGIIKLFVTSRSRSEDDGGRWWFRCIRPGFGSGDRIEQRPLDCRRRQHHGQHGGGPDGVDQ